MLGTGRGEGVWINWAAESDRPRLDSDDAPARGAPMDQGEAYQPRCRLA